MKLYVLIMGVWVQYTDEVRKAGFNLRTLDQKWLAEGEIVR